MELILQTDGASRGNPGPAAFGVVLSDTQGRILQEFGRKVGVATNNEAEYRGLLVGLDVALAHKPSRLEIRLDSELLVGQLKGNYRIRAANLKPLNAKVKRKLKQLSQVHVVHVPRSWNSRADALANRALDS